MHKKVVALSFVAVAAFFILSLVRTDVAFGQTGGLLGLTPEQLEALRNQPEEQAPVITDTLTLQRAQAGQQTAPRYSLIEDSMSTRAGTDLRQFGYEAFENVSEILVASAGAIQDSYILGQGDEIIVTLRGQESTTRRVRVDRDGRVVLPRINPIPGAGRTLADIRADIAAAVLSAYVATEAFVSVGEIRRISVMVAGEVNAPGVVLATALSSPLDALALAGGIKRSGSLRNVKLLRGGQVIPIDLYQFLAGTQNAAVPPRLADGDRIIVPPIGRIVAVSGNVRRPAIFELQPGANTTSIRELLDMAGGLLLRGRYRFQVTRVAADGRLQIVDLGQNLDAAIADSEVLSAQLAVSETVGELTVSGGGTRLGGRYTVATERSLRELLRKPGMLGNDPYMLFGVLSRRDKESNQRMLIAFSPIAVRNGQTDLRLEENDVVRLFTRSEAELLIADAVRAQQAQIGVATQEVTRDLSTGTGNKRTDTIAEVATDVAASNDVAPGAGTTEFAEAAVAVSVSRGQVDEAAKTLEVSPAALLALALRHSASIQGAVKAPGRYLMVGGTSVEAMLRMAGGFSTDAEHIELEISRGAPGAGASERVLIPGNNAQQLKDTILRDNDFIVARAQQSNVFGEVSIAGEVVRPGRYPISRGERLSDIIARAGGLTSAAYPDGAVFLRKSAAQEERLAMNRRAQELEQQVVASATDETFSPEAITFLQSLAASMRASSPAGRISIEADPILLAAKPEFDIRLEDGDTIMFPGRPGTVLVSGQVMMPQSYVYVANWDVSDYIEAAGGYTRFADEDYVILIYPNGRAEQVSDSIWRIGGRVVPPGSIIIVSRDLKPFNLGQFLTDVTQVVSQLAISAASLAIVGRE